MSGFASLTRASSAQPQRSCALAFFQAVAAAYLRPSVHRRAREVQQGRRARLHSHRVNLHSSIISDLERLQASASAGTSRTTSVSEDGPPGM
jgi:hypothetical protein